MSVTNEGLAIARALFPPADGASVRQWRAWSRNVSIILGVSIAMNVTHIVWACGFLAVVGLPGFVRADDNTLKTIQKTQGELKSQFQIVQNDQKTIQENQLDAQIQQARERQCHAMSASNSEAKAFATDKPQDRLSQYYKLMGRPYYRLPDCSEL